MGESLAQQCNRVADDLQGKNWVKATFEASNLLRAVASVLQESRTPGPATAKMLEEMWGHMLDSGDMWPKDWADAVDVFFTEWNYSGPAHANAPADRGGAERVAEIDAELARLARIEPQREWAAADDHDAQIAALESERDELLRKSAPADRGGEG